MLVSCERAAEMMRDLVRFAVRCAEGPHRKMADRAGHAVANRGRSCREIRGDDVGLGIHLHAVDHRQEILLRAG